MDYRPVQIALRVRGFDPGPIDGVWGRVSIASLKAFQRSAGLIPDGVLGPASLGALNAARTVLGRSPVLPIAAPPVWYHDAQRFVGLKETPGPGSNSVIMGWARAAGSKIAGLYTSDAVAWCGLFVESRIAATLPDEPLPGNPLWALDWIKLGVNLTEPALGAVCVFSRAGGGHVGFYAGEDAIAGTIRVLGGNQSDAVTYANIARSRLVGFRWPATVPLPNTGRIAATATGPVSTNEA